MIKNLFLAFPVLLGVMVADVALACSESDHPSQSKMMKDFIKKLPTQKAEMFKEDLKKLHDVNKPVHAQMSKIEAEVKDIVTAQSFDQAAFDAKTQELEGLKAQAHNAFHQIIVKHMSNLSPQERKALVSAMHDHQHK